MTAKRFGYGMILLGSLVTLGNLLWLLGLAPKPPEDLLGARWGYATVAYLLGVGLIGPFSND